MKKITAAQLNTIAGWVCRIFLGIVFTYSGFVKGIDPYGTIYKMGDYLGAMGFSVVDSLLVVGVFGLCAYEFMVGIFFLTGSYRKATPILAAVMMLFFTPLTLWLAIANPVADCGCFGDAMKLTNWETFWKNVVLCLAIAKVWRSNKKLHWGITPALQWIALVATGLFIVTIEWIGYVYQPLIDFRNYPIGEELVSMADHDESQDYIFIYEKDGERKEYSIDDEMPDESDGWTFVDRKKVERKGADATGSDKTLTLFSPDGEEDLTREAILEEGSQLVLMMPKLENVAIASSYKINSLYDWCEKKGVEMIAVVNGSEEEIDQWRDLSMAPYEIYLADDTSIEEVVRGNPGVIYMEDGKVVWKSTMHSILVDDFIEDNSFADLRSLARDNGWILSRLCWIYAILMVALVLFSFLPVLLKPRP